jgi:hypothetical protein
MRTLKAFLFVLIIVTFSNGCTITHEYGPYFGKVIDSETKEPIEGAVVLVVFYTEEYGPAGAITRYADAVETITDKNGEFKVSDYRVSVFRPLQGWDLHPQFRIFKPGYGCFPEHKYATWQLNVKEEDTSVPTWSLPPQIYVTVELPRLKTRKESIESTHCSPDSDVPYLKAKKFIDLINEENKSLGLNIEQYK